MLLLKHFVNKFECKICRLHSLKLFLDGVNAILHSWTNIHWSFGTVLTGFPKRHLDRTFKFSSSPASSLINHIQLLKRWEKEGYMKRVKTSKGMRSPSFVKKPSIQNVLRTDKTCAIKKAPQQYRSNSLGGLSLLVGEHENARFGTSHYCLQNEFIHEGIL